METILDLARRGEFTSLKSLVDALAKGTQATGLDAAETAALAAANTSRQRQLAAGFLGARGITVPRLRRGFGAMSPEQRQAIASAGGRASHVLGTGHTWTSETARAAGRKGGVASHGGRGRDFKPATAG